MTQVVVRSMKEEEGRKPVEERKAKLGKDQILNCPRCNSSNIKFCYYNNYSLSQPRYFCKYCRRYWTAGGSLRNIPVGGTSRKNKRPSAKFSSPKNNKNNDGDDDEDRSHPIIINGSSKSNINTPSSSSSNATTSCCWLSSDGMNQRELIPFMPMPAAAAPQPASMCTTADEGGEAGRLLSSSTVEDFKQLPSIISAYQNGGKWGDVPAFWNGNFGGGSW